MHPAGSAYRSLTFPATLVLPVVILAAASYFQGVPQNPPGFYIDESSIAYNAYTISRTGRDEYGAPWPLYFRAFGEYKNPVYIYLLAALFRVFGPSILLARLFSATLGLASAVLLWLLAWRITRREMVAQIVGLSALVTPWLFENSRLVFEVALYPSLLGLFLFVLYGLTKKEQWTLFDILTLAVTLSLLTYSCSIGRLLAPLFAGGLAFFITRRRLRSVLATWVTYALTLVPALVFNHLHPGALMSRFWLLTYITSERSPVSLTLEFFRRYAANFNPWRLAVTGELNVRDHLGHMGSVLLPTIILASIGIILVWRCYRRDAWWRFLLYALVVSAVPASLTSTDFPQIRLVALPVLLHVFLIPAVWWLMYPAESFVVTRNDGRGRQPQELEARSAPTDGRSIARRVTLWALMTLMLVQGLVFRFEFYRVGPGRWYIFDEQFPREVFPTALSFNKKPIYLYDPSGKSGYIQAYWYGILRGMDATDFVRLPQGASPPEGAVVISTEEECGHCRLILKSINYIVYLRGT